MQGFFHGWGAETKPLLHEVNTQHGLQRKGWTPCLPGRRMWRYQSSQFSPWHHQIHLIKEVSLARPLGNQFKFSGGKTHLFHHGLTFAQSTGLTYAENP